jgi:hypothetical protein
MRARQATASALGAILLVGGLSGCATSEVADASNTPALAGPPSTAKPRAVAKQATTHPRRAAPMTRIEMLRALSDLPRKKRSVHLAVELRTRALTITGDGTMSYSPTDPAMELEMAGSSVSSDYVEVVAVHGLFFFAIPGVVPDGKYARIDPMSPTSPMGPDFAKLSGQLDPLSALLALHDGFRGMHYTGRGTVYGEAMTTYSLTVDLRAGAASRGVRVPATTVTYHLWFGSQRLLRKETVQIDGVKVTVEYDRWGEPVHISQPAPSEMAGEGTA